MTSHDECFARVAAVVRATFHVGAGVSITRQTTSADIDGWDSLAHSMLVMAIEEEFGVDLPFDRAFALNDVGELTDLVSELVPG